jgi:DNA-binding NtrC family response regulator
VSKPTILVVDDDPRIRQLVRDILNQEGYEAQLCSDGRDAARLLSLQKYDLVITDLMMPFHNGIEILEIARQINPDCVVLLITGYGTVESAVNAIRKGAYDYLQKPFEPEELLLTVQRAAEHARLLYENRELRLQVEGCRGEELVGAGLPIKALKDLVARIAPFDTTVLIQGETGTGKELVAKLIHQWSKRREQVFLAVNCGALPESLLESELFGHVRGAFTGAEQDKAGLFETVDRGTIFLDEIDSTTPAFQVKLLRVLQEGTILKVGGRSSLRVDVRVIAATSTPLEKEVEAGRFRSDLFYRLNVVTIDIPPLRRRREDIPLLAHHFLSKYNTRYAREVRAISGPVLARLRGYSWPGNVRELENVIERAVIMATGPELRPENLPLLSAAGGLQEELEKEMVSLAQMEKIMIARALQRTGGHKGKSAEALGISPVSLWRKIKKYGLG